MEEFLHTNQLYVVLIVVLTMWIGFLLYMFRLDSKITKIEKLIKK